MEETRKGILMRWGQRPVMRRGKQKLIMKQDSDIATVWTEPGFLAAERERRQHDEARRKHEEEQRKWEEERAAWEKEKRAMEEERRKRMYAEEVAAARSRRESTRLGLAPVSNEGLATGQWDRG